MRKKKILITKHRFEKSNFFFVFHIILDYIEIQKTKSKKSKIAIYTLKKVIYASLKLRVISIIYKYND